MRQSFPRARVDQLSLAIAVSLALFAVSCARLPRRATEATGRQLSSAANEKPTSARVNLNLAAIAELEKLPGVGPVLAERIVAHRQQYGPFRRVEHLMMVRGFSDNKFRTVRDLVTVE